MHRRSVNIFADLFLELVYRRVFVFAIRQLSIVGFLQRQNWNCSCLVVNFIQAYSDIFERASERLVASYSQR